MPEFLLPESEWPAIPAVHRAFLARAIPVFRSDDRLVGVAAGGSFINRVLDEQSDLDLVVVSRPDAATEVLGDGPALARRLGPLLAAFTGDHVGELRLLICLFGPPLLHVDLKFLSTLELDHRIEEPRILWDRSGAVRAGLAETSAAYPAPRLQWIEDRFWVWMHYIDGKIARGELFEAIDGLSFIRARVLGPLVLAETSAQPNGVRRIEQSAPERVAALRTTIASHDRESCRRALRATAGLYTDLRERLAPQMLERRTEAERAVMPLLDDSAGPKENL